MGEFGEEAAACNKVDLGVKLKQNWLANRERL